MHRCRLVRGAGEHRRAVRRRRRRVLDRGGRVLDRSRSVLHGSRRVLHRRRRVRRGLLRCVDHRPARAAVARDSATGTTRALNDGTFAAGTGRAMLSGDTATVDRTTHTRRAVLRGDTAAADRAAAPERGTFLAEDAAVRPGPSSSSAGQGAAGSGVRGAAGSPRAGGSAGMAAQAGPTRQGLGRRVATQRIAAATQGTDAALAADAQACAATRTRLASDTDTP